MRQDQRFRKHLLSGAVASLMIVLACPLFAQDEHPTVRFGGSIGAGFTNPVYSTGHRLDTGWNIGASAGANVGDHFGLLGEFMFNRFGVNSATLSSLEFPAGNMNLWSLTMQPVFYLNHGGRVDGYITGGGGWYHRLTEFTQPSVATFTGFDPFFGFFPVDVPTNEVLTSHSVNKGGLNLGAGLTFGIPHGAKMFMEARYHHMYTRPNATTLLPVTFGVRW